MPHGLAAFDSLDPPLLPYGQLLGCQLLIFDAPDSTELLFLLSCLVITASFHPAGAWAQVQELGMPSSGTLGEVWKELSCPGLTALCG